MAEGSGWRFREVGGSLVTLAWICVAVCVGVLVNEGLGEGATVSDGVGVGVCGVGVDVVVLVAGRVPVAVEDG